MAQGEDERPERERGALAPATNPTGNAFLPLVLLLLVLVVIGCLNTSLVEPYTQPRAVADEGGAYLFYDATEHAGSAERTFLLRRYDGSHFDKAQRVEGTLRSVALLSSEHLVCLFPDFVSLYARPRQLEREWSTVADAEAIGFEPGHLARLDGKIYAFGSQAKDGALRVARLDPLPARAPGGAVEWRLVPLDARVPKAAEAPGADIADNRGDEGPPTVPAPVAWASAPATDGTLDVLFRVARPRSGAGDPVRGAVRLARFDGTAFVGSAVKTLDEDWAALAAAAVPADTAGVTTEVHVFAVRRDDAVATPSSAAAPPETPRGEGRIVELVLEGHRLREVGSIPYRRGGFFEERPASALAAVSQQGRVLLFAQVGGAVRVNVKEGGRWGEWADVAKMPTEATALVYFYLGCLFLLGLVMATAALWTLKTRLSRPRAADLDQATADRFLAEALGSRAPSRAATRGATEDAEGTDDPAENDAPIHDRVVAFLIDVAIVYFVFLKTVHAAFPLDWTPKPGDDPTLQLAMRAWCIVALVGYVTLWEVFFGRTPGKRLLGLELRTLDGKAPTVLARLYRNLFRIELIFFVTAVQIPQSLGGELHFVGPLIALAVMLATPRAQRPGDLVAGTVVQRSRDVRPLPSATAAEDEEESQA